jgi:5-methylcytosine-specific restriction endonuclease McrA
MKQRTLQERHFTYASQYRKCGKSYCKTCAQGEGHGPYIYVYWREHEKIYNCYLGSARRLGGLTEEALRDLAQRSTQPVPPDGTLFTHQGWLEIKQRYNSTCLCCRRKEPEIKLVADHITPRSKGGPNILENIQPLCVSCNARKGIRMTDYRS